jgi:hypothetical protein
MAGDKIIAGTQPPAPATVRKDDDTSRFDRKPEYALQNKFPFCDLDIMFV